MTELGEVRPWSRRAKPATRVLVSAWTGGIAGALVLRSPVGKARAGVQPALALPSAPVTLLEGEGMSTQRSFCL